MEEKIKIYVPESVNNILLKDMERFEFFKNDNTFNKNEFYNTLIYNYHEEYHETQSVLFEHIKKTVSSDIKCSELIINDLARKILDYVDLKSNRLDEEKSEITLSIKPTRITADTFDFIQNYCIGESSLSSYFRNMFAAYSLLPQDKRERIIFRPNFELLEKAIKEKRTVYFTTVLNDNPHIVSPYSIANSKEELFNYLLAEYNAHVFSFRIGRIRKLKILNEPATFAKENIDAFKRMAEQGPQFAYNSDISNFEIKMFLTDRGKEMYKSIYLHRPKCSRIDGDFYSFDCSIQQAYQYFSRFGKNAIAVEPKELTDQLFRYFSTGSKAYYKYVNYGTLKDSNNKE